MEHVIFNALQTSLSGGIGRYSFELGKAIYESGEIDIKIVIREEDLCLFNFVKKQDLIVAKGIKNSFYRNFYEQFILPIKINREYPNSIIHYPDSMAPLFSKNKVVITVHDLAFKTLNGAYNWKSSLWKNFCTDLSVKKADKIIAITNFAFDELKKYYPNINSKKISVIYNGFNDFSKENINLNNVRENIIKLAESDYLFTVSTISPRKNIDGLIKAFNIIKDDITNNLVIAGKKGWLYKSVFTLVNELNLKDRVIFTDGVNDDELKLLYKNANAFVYPSFYEGFGLPPLEAMSFGIPCIVSNTTCMPEVIGNAAILVDPRNIQEIKNAIITIIKNRNNERAHFLKRGYQQIKKYSWKKSAYEVINTYEKIMEVK